MKKPKKREYTLDDLVAIAAQIGAVVRMELIPIEAFQKKDAPQPQPEKKKQP